MTAIAGLASGGRVWIGGDSAGVSGYDITVRKDKKVFENGPMLFGFSGSFRVGQLLQYALVIPEREEGVSVDKYMVTTFIDALRKVLKDAGALKKDSDEESPRTLFLVGYEGRLFAVHNDLQVGEPMDGYDAVGCGERYVKGSLFSTGFGAGLAPAERVRRALDAAAYHSGGVTPPFTILSNATVVDRNGE